MLSRSLSMLRIVGSVVTAVRHEPSAVVHENRPRTASCEHGIHNPLMGAIAVRVTAAFCLVAMLAACGQASPAASPSTAPAPAASAAAASPETHIVLGTLAVAGRPIAEGNGGCDTAFGEVADGANVVVKDEHGTTVGTSTLKIVTFGGDESQCHFAFTAVLPRAGFYHVSVAGRDGPTISFDDLAKASWKWEMALGG
jgi:hypothetical protein